MSITPQEFLNSAVVLASIDTSEVHQRNAISRLYYAAYHRSCEFIKPDGKDRGFGSHRSYIEQLLESAPGSLARRVGVSLEVVYIGRVRSDYRLTDTVLPREFSTFLNRTRELFTLFNTSQQQLPVRSTSTIKVVK